MKQLILAISLVGFLCFPVEAEEIPSKLKKKIEKEFKKQDIEGSFEFKPFDVSGVDAAAIQNRKLYHLFVDGKDMGLICLTSAKGRYENFDYWVWIGNDGRIRMVRVYKYRSDYGGEITARSWLKQFDGKMPGYFVLGSNVDAISGATISSNALVDDLNSFEGLIKQIKEMLD